MRGYIFPDKMQQSIFPDKMQQNIFMDNIQRDNKTTRQLDNDTTTTTRQWQPIPTNGSDNTCLHLRSPKSQKHCFLVEVSGKKLMKIIDMDHFCWTHPHKTENLVFFSPFVCNFQIFCFGPSIMDHSTCQFVSNELDKISS